MVWLQRDFHIYMVNVFDTEKACQVTLCPSFRKLQASKLQHYLVKNLVLLVTTALANNLATRQQRLQAVLASCACWISAWFSQTVAIPYFVPPSCAATGVSCYGGNVACYAGNVACYTASRHMEAWQSCWLYFTRGCVCVCVCVCASLLLHPCCCCCCCIPSEGLNTQLRHGSP